jgi:hypothetical protein
MDKRAARWNPHYLLSVMSPGAQGEQIMKIVAAVLTLAFIAISPAAAEPPGHHALLRTRA